jgi:hypothetical protein
VVDSSTFFLVFHHTDTHLEVLSLDLTLSIHNKLRFRFKSLITPTPIYLYSLEFSLLPLILNKHIPVCDKFFTPSSFIS